MTYNIVINNSLLNSIKTINIFKIDLGRSILNKKTFKREFNDDFVENYTEMNKRIIHKCGSIGSITFYVDTLVENNILLIYADNILYDVIVIGYNPEIILVYDNTKEGTHLRSTTSLVLRSFIALLHENHKKLSIVKIHCCFPIYTPKTPVSV